MTHREIVIAIAAACLSALAVPALAADPPPPKAPAGQQIYGHQLMTPEERLDYRNRMRGLKTPEERQAFRLEHHKLMQERARERGLTLPDAPAPRGRMQGGPRGGMGPGMGGMGPGMGGMGPGMGGPRP